MKNFMKKFIALLLVFAVMVTSSAFLLSGCTNNDGAGNGAGNGAQTGGQTGGETGGETGGGDDGSTDGDSGSTDGDSGSTDGDGGSTGGDSGSTGGGTGTTPVTPESPKDSTEDLSDNKIRVFILTGQSNAVGVADTNDLPADIDRTYEDVMFYVNGDTTQNNVSNFNQWTTVQNGYGIHTGCSGSELGMASVLSQVYPKGTDGKYNCAIIKYAWGGTGLAELWLSENGYDVYKSTGGNANYVDYNGRKVGKLYKEMMETIKNGLNGLVSQGYEPVVSGMAWMQGCNDAYSMTWANNYDGMLECMIKDIRTSLNVPNMPVAIGEIGILFSQYSDIIRDKQYKVGTTYPDCYFVSQHDLDLKPEDWWHFDAISLYKLGRRYISHILTSYRDLVVPTTATYSQESSVQTDYRLPQFVEATTQSGIKLPLEVIWDRYGSATATGNVQVNGTFKNSTGTAKATVSITAEPDVDGRIDILGDKVWTSASKMYLKNGSGVGNGSYIQTIKTDKGLYIAGMMYDTDMIIWETSDWYNLIQSDQVQLYIYTGTATSGASRDKMTAVYITPTNTVSVYRGSASGWDAIERYRNRPLADSDMYRGKIQHAVKPFGTLAFGDRHLYFEGVDGATNIIDKDIGYSFELFMPYETLGITASQKNNIKINAGQADKYSWKDRTVYKLNGGAFDGVHENDDLSIFKAV